MSINKNLVWIDTLKGLAICLVVFNHSFMANNNFFTAECFYIFNFFNYIHIPIFFFVSGFFAVKSTETPFVQNLKAKFKSLFYPYIIWSLILGTFYLIGYNIHLFDGNISNKISIIDFFLFLVKPFSILWFLYALFFTNLLFFCTQKFINLKMQFIISIFLAVFSPFIRIWPLNFGVAKFYIFFIFGIIFYRLYNENFLKLNKAIITLLFINFLVIIIAFSQIQLYKQEMLFVLFSNILIYLGIISGLCSIIYFSHLIQIKDAFIAYLGKMSLYIYLLHPFSVMVSRTFLKSFDNLSNLYALTIIPMIIGLLMPLYFYKIIKIMRMEKLLFGR